MEFSNAEVALYVVAFLKREEFSEFDFTQEEIARALDISPKTLSVYLSECSKKGYVIRSRIRKVKRYVNNVQITESGEKIVDKIEEFFENCVLSPERHNTPSIIPFKEQLKKFRDPLIKVGFISIYLKMHSFDFMTYLQALETVLLDAAAKVAPGKQKKPARLSLFGRRLAKA